MNLEKIKEDFKNGKFTKWEYIDRMYELHSALFDYSHFIKDTNISSIEIKDDQVITTFRDSEIKFYCIQGDKRLAPLDTLNFSEYEKAELDFQYQLIQPQATVIDIGANLGWYSMHISKRYPKCIVYAFEPVPNTFEYLKKNIQINNLSNIHTYPLGLSDQVGEMELYFDPLLSVNASLKNVSENQNAKKIVGKFTTLDSFCKTHHVKNVDFIKCDVEGAEFYSLKGSNNTLKKYKPIVFVEMLRKWTKKFNYHPNDIISYMKELNYVCTTINLDRLNPISTISEETIETNFFFLHAENHKQQLLDFSQ